jgi:hypothetical protein
MKRNILLITLFICIGTLSPTIAQSLTQKTEQKCQRFYPNFSDNALIDKNMKAHMRPHLLPLNHPIKPILDAIFSRSRATESERSLIAAGFTILFSQEKTFIEIAKHPRMPGYIFKIYLDSEKKMKDDQPGWKRLTTRCKVSNEMRNFFRKKKIRHFSVAKKWLYPLPTSPLSTSENPQPVILIATDMDIYAVKDSQNAWETLTTEEHLDELYSILHHGYGSARLAKNVPYSRSGKFTFIDTEYERGKKKIHLSRIKQYLSPAMQQYWDKITKTTTEECKTRHGKAKPSRSKS